MEVELVEGKEAESETCTLPSKDKGIQHTDIQRLKNEYTCMINK